MFKFIKNSLYKKLKTYSASGVIPMHMPGHKRKRLAGLPYDIDITEINDFDNLHGGTGVLKETCEIIQNLYSSKKSFMLINGSTCGILAGIRCAVNMGDKILVARNCHKSVYNAIELNCLNAIYLVPEIDFSTNISSSIIPMQIEEKLKQNSDIKLIVITSPSYEGVISDVKAITTLAHKYGVPVLIDEAHGAHLYSAKNSAVLNGADIVINSLPKTLPALTQTAVAHINGDLISPEKFARELSVFETSSPSYVLMSSIDLCVRLLTENGDKLFANLYKNLKWFESEISNLQNLKVIGYGNDSIKEHKGFFDFDLTKIIISTNGTSISGTELIKIFREKYNIELEMAYSDYALAMVTIFDSKKTLKQLARAITGVDGDIKKTNSQNNKNNYSIPVKFSSASEVKNSVGELIDLKDAISRVSLEYVWAYPPGIPLIVPGEIISEQLIQTLLDLNDSGVEIYSTQKAMPQKIMVI